MNNRLVSLSFSNDQLTAIDASLEQLENQLGGLVSLTMDQRRAAPKMGAKSEQFCRETVNMLEQNPLLAPPSLGLDEAPAQLATLDELRPRALRLRRIVERINDTEFGLSSDVMRSSLKGYSVLKLAGNNQGLENLRKSLGARFSKVARTPPPEAKAA